MLFLICNAFLLLFLIIATMAPLCASRPCPCQHCIFGEYSIFLNCNFSNMLGQPYQSITHREILNIDMKRIKKVLYYG